MNSFTHLHVHTEYSIIDGISRIKDLVKSAKSKGMNALAVTDHGNMYGAIDLYTECLNEGIKPIIGSEIYVAINDYKIKDQTERSPYHLTVLAKNNIGYKNLVKLLSIGNTEGFYYRPRIDKKILEEYKEGLILLSGCVNGEIARLIIHEGYDAAKKMAEWYSSTFDDYFLEIMRHENVDNLDLVNQNIIKLSNETNIPLVATNDSHYTEQIDANAHDVCLCIQTNSQIDSTNRMKFDDQSYYLKSPQEMSDLFADLPESISNTQLIADMCDIKLDLETTKIPIFNIEDGSDSWTYLQKQCAFGFKKLFSNPSDLYKERMRYELDVIKQTNYANYFLVVWDIAKYSLENNITFNVRGSAAASLVLYCLGVTLIDPLEYNLVFERFLNLERKEMPDVDLDFQDNKREMVLQYVVEKYGIEHVAQIITFGTYGARGSIRDTGRVMGLNYAEIDPIAKAVPFGPNITIETALESKEMQAFIPNYQKLLNTSRSIEGLTRHVSTHAAAVVISESPLNEFVPLQTSSKSNSSDILMTQYAMDPIAKLGLLKMDFLGLSNLTIIADCFEAIKNNRDKELSINSINLEDEKTFDLLSEGKTMGVFQLEGSGMKRYIQELKPTTLSDVSAMIALYRPGPMEQISKFIDGKHGQIPSYIHKVLENNLEETYGVIVYQDQVLYIFREMAGYSLGEADIVRKSMGKKIPEIMLEEKNKFITRCINNGYEEELASKVFALIEPFAGYAFNKAHSVSYALISYITAYLKANYLDEFLITSMNSSINNSDRINLFVKESKLNNIEVLPPDINESKSKFSLYENGKEKYIRYGLTAIKNVGIKAAESLVEIRETLGGFKSLEHVFENIDLSVLNTKTIESLIKVGAFDQFADRSAMLEKIDDFIAVSSHANNAKKHNQTSMFEYLPEDQKVKTEINLNSNMNTKSKDKQLWELELLGLKLSINYQNEEIIKSVSDDYITTLEQINDTPVSDLRDIKILGQTLSIDKLSYTDKKTNQIKPYFKSQIDLLDSELELVSFNQNFNQMDLWDETNLVVIEGYARMRNNQLSIYFNNATKYIPQSNGFQSNESVKSNNVQKDNKCLVLTINNIVSNDPRYAKLINIIKNSEGNTPVFIKFQDKNLITYSDLYSNLHIEKLIKNEMNDYCDINVQDISDFVLPSN